MPQLGQRPGSSETTSGCIGHMYVVAIAMSFMPQLGQRPGSSETTSGCIGHV